VNQALCEKGEVKDPWLAWMEELTREIKVFSSKKISELNISMAVFATCAP
jgi:hypothetical protein